MKKKVTFLPLKNHFSLSQFTWLSCLETCFLVGTTSIRQSGTQGALTGVGLSIGYPTVIDESSAGLVVISSTPGTPTSRAGIMSRDIILAIDGINTGTMGIYDAAERLQREKVSLNPVKSRLCEVAAGGKGTSRIGYIKLTTFNQNASNVVKDAIETLRRNNVNAFVLDLHDNRLKKGVIMYIYDSRGVRDIYEADGSDAIATSKPLAVLVCFLIEIWLLHSPKLGRSSCLRIAVSVTPPAPTPHKLHMLTLLETSTRMESTF